VKLHGQRWLYRLGNAEIAVENAFSWWGWAQERWLINGDVIHETGGWFAIRRAFNEPWLTPLGDGTLAVELRSRPTGVDCSVMLDGEALKHDALFETSWRGRRRWPTADDWKEVTDFSIFSVLSQP
jgi:hypothetical protein